ncbi:MAG: hypothetical protein J6D03_05585 [Clostridia bacterium]|nr:hypothetical protein [Clostridia bacterium]
MKLRIRNKQINNFFTEYCDVWVNPNTGDRILIPCSGRRWNLFLRACNCKQYKKLAYNVIKAYFEFFSEFDTDSKDFNDFKEHSEKILKIYQ